MIRTFLARSSWYYRTGKRRPHPLYTYGELLLDLAKYAPAQVVLYTASRCVEITADLAREFAAERIHHSQGPRYQDRVSPFLLTVPHKGYVVIAANPTFSGGAR